jgi:hypothetical protein
MLDSTSEQPFPSTTFAWKLVKVRRPAEGQVQPAQRSLFWRRHHRRDLRRPVEVTIHLRGGAESWVEVRSRGSLGRFPGHTAIYDILCAVCNVEGDSASTVAGAERSARARARVRKSD